MRALPTWPVPGRLAGISRTVLLAAAVAAALPSAAFAATVTFRIDRTSADPEERTFSGSGFLEFDGPTSDPADISVLSVRVETLGTVHPEDGDSFPTTHVFVFDRTNVTAVSGLALAGTGLTGSIDFDGVLSEGAGLVFMDDFRLDFDAGVASGFCYGSSDILAECIVGGGSSSGVEAILAPAPILLPASLPLLALTIGGLGVMTRRKAEATCAT